MTKNNSNRKEYFKLYGHEWSAISKIAKSSANYTCSECGKKYTTYYLDLHHIIPISFFIEAGYDENGIPHHCYGILTTRIWHVEANLRVLCYKCHSKLHSHLGEEYIKAVEARKRDKFRSLS